MKQGSGCAIEKSQYSADQMNCVGRSQQVNKRTAGTCRKIKPPVRQLSPREILPEQESQSESPSTPARESSFLPPVRYRVWIAPAQAWKAASSGAARTQRS